jgi:ABC-type uncharacterized transport system auxiliary subunit
MKRLVLAMILLVSMTACRSSSPTVQHYQLFSEPRALADRQVTDVVLAIDPFVIDSAYDDQRMIYRTSAHRLNHYHFHRWSAPPGLLITDFVRDAYIEQGAFAAVVSGYSSQSDVILTGRVFALEEVNLPDGRWLARVAMHLQLRDTRTGTIIWVQRLEEQVPIEEKTPEGLARAVSVALMRIVESTTQPMVEAAVGRRVNRQGDWISP